MSIKPALTRGYLGQGELRARMIPWYDASIPAEHWGRARYGCCCGCPPCAESGSQGYWMLAMLTDVELCPETTLLSGSLSGIHALSRLNYGNPQMECTYGAKIAEGTCLCDYAPSGLLDVWCMYLIDAVGSPAIRWEVLFLVWMEPHDSYYDYWVAFMSGYQPTGSDSPVLFRAETQLYPPLPPDPNPCLDVFEMQNLLQAPTGCCGVPQQHPIGARNGEVSVRASND